MMVVWIARESSIRILKFYRLFKIKIMAWWLSYMPCNVTILYSTVLDFEKVSVKTRIPSFNDIHRVSLKLVPLIYQEGHCVELIETTPKSEVFFLFFSFLLFCFFFFAFSTPPRIIWYVETFMHLRIRIGCFWWWWWCAASSLHMYDACMYIHTCTHLVGQQ